MYNRLIPLTFLLLKACQKFFVNLITFPFVLSKDHSKNCSQNLTQLRSCQFLHNLWLPFRLVIVSNTVIVKSLDGDFFGTDNPGETTSFSRQSHKQHLQATCHQSFEIDHTAISPCWCCPGQVLVESLVERLTALGICTTNWRAVIAASLYFKRIPCTLTRDKEAHHCVHKRTCQPGQCEGPAGRNLSIFYN